METNQIDISKTYKKREVEERSSWLQEFISFIGNVFSWESKKPKETKESVQVDGEQLLFMSDKERAGYSPVEEEVELV